MRTVTEHLPYEVWCHGSGEAFFAARPERRSGCIITEVRLGAMSGLQVLERLRAEKHPLSVVFLSEHADVPLAVRAMRCGAMDFLEKPFRPQRLLDAIYQGILLSRSRCEALQRRDDLQARFDNLTERELEVIERIFAGQCGKSIARDLCISPQAVDARRLKAMGKLGVSSLAELIRLTTERRIAESVNA